MGETDKGYLRYFVHQDVSYLHLQHSLHLMSQTAIILILEEGAAGRGIEKGNGDLMNADGN